MTEEIYSILRILPKIEDPEYLLPSSNYWLYTGTKQDCYKAAEMYFDYAPEAVQLVKHVAEIPNLMALRMLKRELATYEETCIPYNLKDELLNDIGNL